MSHNGKLLTQIMNNLDKKPRKVRTPDNQWQRPGQVTTVNSPNITMEGVGFDAIGIDVNGYKQYMQDGHNYQFTGPVTEYPLMQVDPNFAQGGEMIRRADGSYSRRGLWDNIRANRGSGKKPTKEMLEQERKIKAKSMKYGGTNNPGFEALPEYVQAKIMSNMGYGGYFNPVMAHGGDPDGGMAIGQIMAMHEKLSALQKFIRPNSDLEPWVASKLTLADDYLNSVADYMQYNPEENQEMQEMGGGGYVVTRSHDRKGKTHKVTGPDGTVKYFGDSKLGQHPKDPERKKAFYARHKKNLDRNPYFRAFARATWEDGGQIEEMANGGDTPEQAAIDRLQKREDRLVAKGYKAVDEGRENKADRILGRAARVEDRKIKLMNNMANGSGIYYQPGGPVNFIPADATYVKKPFVPQQYGINPAEEYIVDGIDPDSVTSVVDFLDLLGMDYSKKNRAVIAKQMGVKNYDYSAKKNNELLYAIKNNGEKVGKMPYSFVGNKSPYYQSGGSIVDFLASRGERFDKAYRAELAKKYNVDNYDYSAEKNLELLGILRNKMGSATSEQVKDPVGTKSVPPPAKKQGNYGPLPGSPNGVGFDPYASPSKDKRNLESGTIVDKGTNTMYIINKGKVVKSAPVLTGQAGRNGKKDPNMNPYSVAYLENNPGNRSTPTGTYFMNPNANIYGWPGFNLQPINAYGEQAPNAKNTAIHITYGANAKPGLQGHPDPAEFKRRNAAYTNNSADRYRSYGCTNAQGQTIDCLQTQFPKGDTAIYIDSRNPIDMKYINSVKRKKNGGYVGNDGKRHVSHTPTWSGFAGYEMGGYIPEFMGGGYCYECGGMYKSGGPVIGEEMDVTPQELELLRAQGYEFEII